MTHAPMGPEPTDDEHEQALEDLLADLDDAGVEQLGALAEEDGEEEEMSRSRFSRLSAALAEKGAHNPDALAAHIGRRKYGRAGMAALAAKGRAKKATKRSAHPDGAEILRYDRMWPLDDILIRSGGDGRTVEAYAAVFDTPSEIKDQHGHYMEVIARTAFNRAISHGIGRINVFYHHGMTLHGTPSDLGSVPIGSPVDIRPDGRGLRTVTRFNRSALADSVLEAIRNDDIKGYSFRGRVFQSDPARTPRPRPGSPLPTVTRTELGLAEYGPTPTPAYADAGILAVRSAAAVAAQIVSLPADERAELVRIIAASTPHDPETETATPDVGPGTEDSPEGRSGRNREKVAAILADLHTQGVL
ncbi:MAG: HK97 family phage prohead protease [Micromonosporaceae bacterium]